jgi:hypothetical protein
LECNYPKCDRCPGLSKIYCYGKCPLTEKFTVFLPHTLCPIKTQNFNPSSTCKPNALLKPDCEAHKCIPGFLDRVWLLQRCKLDESLPVKIYCTRVCDGCYKEKPTDITVHPHVLKVVKGPKHPHKKALAFMKSKLQWCCDECNVHNKGSARCSMVRDDVVSIDPDKDEGWEDVKSGYLHSHLGFEFPC